MDIKALKPSSAKLLLHLLVNGGLLVNLSALAASLDMDRKTVTAARQELLDRRFVGENMDIDPSITAQLVSIFSPHFLRTAEIFPTSKPQGEELFPTEENIPIARGDYLPTEEELPTNPRTRCAQADRSGERPRQVEALHVAFGARFPGKPQPNDESMRILLRLTEDSAEAVDEAFESAAVRPIESPWSYVRAMLARQKAEAPRPSPTSRSDEPQPPSPEEVARWKQAEAAMLRRGILPADGGDR